MIQTFIDIDEAQAERYERLLLQRDTPQPIYCSQPDCSGFLGSMRDFVNRVRKDARCPECEVSTCVLCRNTGHGGDCDLGELEEVMQHFMIRRCPNCGQATMKNGGCSHMKCEGCGADYTWQKDGGIIPW